MYANLILSPISCILSSVFCLLFSILNPTTKPLLRLENVNLYAKLTSRQRLNLQGQAILQDITLSIPEASHVAILGASGSGKSFLLRLLNRLTEPSSGKIFWQDTPYNAIPPLDLRQRVVLAPQIPKLLGMTVEESLQYPLKLRKLDQNTIQTRIEYWLKTLQIPDDWRHKNEQQLSTGQIQQIAIARTLITQPPVILLDEPTAHLPPNIAHHLIQTLNHLTHTENTTIIMVSHQLDLIQEFCRGDHDSIIHLSHGRIINHQAATSVDWNELKANITESKTDEEFDF